MRPLRPFLKLNLAMPLLWGAFLWTEAAPSTVAYAGDWLCEEASSVRRGSEILVCGVGEGPTEDVARNKALVAAQLEFFELCGSSDDCKNHKTISSPLRTSCSPLPQGGVRCYRGLSYEITAEQQSTSIFNEATQQALKAKRKALEEELKALAAIEAEKNEVERLEKKIKEKDYTPVAASDPTAPEEVGGRTAFWAFGFGRAQSGEAKLSVPTFQFEYQSYWKGAGPLGIGFSLGLGGPVGDPVIPSRACGPTCVGLRTERALKDFNHKDLGVGIGIDLGKHWRLMPMAHFSKYEIHEVILSYDDPFATEATFADSISRSEFTAMGPSIQLTYRSLLGPGSALVLEARAVPTKPQHPSVAYVILNFAFGRGW